MKDYKFEFVRAKNTPVTDEEIISDLKQVAAAIKPRTVTQKTYGEHGKYDTSNVGRRFGTWNKALNAAGLTISNKCNITDDALYENILVLWQHYGRQPRRADLSKPPSTISQSAYNRRFQSWSTALKSFVEFANSVEIAVPAPTDKSASTRQVAARDPSLRLRFKVLSRDLFTCQHCGASPAKSLGVELHVDHVVPWSKGGETGLENLQTLCSKCNLGKSNL